MAGDSIFIAADIALLRAAAQPRDLVESATEETDEEGWLRARIVALAADDQLLEAVERASPSLVHDVRKITQGGVVKAKILRRSALALTKYHLRMTTRPTPFGLFAGIAPVRIGRRPYLRFGTQHRPVSKADAAWLSAVLDGVRAEPDLLSGTVVIANNVRFVRNQRLVLPERYDETGERRLEKSIRFTALVREALSAAESAISWTRLLEHVSERFGVDQSQVEPVLWQLVKVGVLLTDLDLPPDCTDPLGFVAAREGHPVFAELRAIRSELRVADAATAARRPSLMRAVAARMRGLHDCSDPIQTDLRLDLDVALPSEAAREAERVAGVLWRLGSVGGPSWLSRYHERFVERFGIDRVVPVVELLDDNRGLGLPPSFRGHDQRVPPAVPNARDRWLAELMLQAVRERRAEVVLDDDILGRLADQPQNERRPASMELCVELLADNWEALCAGEFRMVVGESLGSALAGSTVARFAHLLLDVDPELTRIAQAGAPGGVVHAAQVAFMPRARRSANVSSVPQRLPLRIPLGCGPASAEATDIPLDRLCVGADHDGLFVVDAARGVRIAPVSGSMLNPTSGHVPPVARFLLELGQQDTPGCRPWSWGALAASPYLPGVRYGRTVLAPARWLPSREMLDFGLSLREWQRHVLAWRTAWDVPREVQLTAADNRIAVDLDDPLHLRVLQDELRRTPRLQVLEVPARRPGPGWLGGHACEVVFQLLTRPTTTSRPTVVARQRTADLLHTPGGEWLYAKLYAGETTQREIVRTRLANFVADDVLAESGVGDWFFVHYADPDPHLRLRLHGKPETLWSAVLRRLHAWAAELRRDGLLAYWNLGAYDPEVERYGGVDVMPSAERVFHTDSRLAIALGGCDDLQAAASVLALLHHFGGADDVLDLLSGIVPLAGRRAVPFTRRATLADMITPFGQVTTIPAHTAQPWAARDDAVAAYARKLDASSARLIGANIAHMHCNRLFGIDRAREHAVYALAHGGLALRLNRERHGR